MTEGAAPYSGHQPPIDDAVNQAWQAAERLLAESISGEPGKYPDVEVQRALVRGPATDALLRAADKADLLIIARHTQSKIETLALGSKARLLISNAPCPVLLALADLDAWRARSVASEVG